MVHKKQYGLLHIDQALSQMTSPIKSTESKNKRPQSPRFLQKDFLKNYKNVLKDSQHKSMHQVFSPDRGTSPQTENISESIDIDDDPVSQRRSILKKQQSERETTSSPKIIRPQSQGAQGRIKKLKRIIDSPESIIDFSKIKRRSIATFAKKDDSKSGINIITFNVGSRNVVHLNKGNATQPPSGIQSPLHVERHNVKHLLERGVSEEVDGHLESLG